MLALLSSVAQGESENKSESIKWACRNRFSRGIPLFPTWCILGYDKDEFGNIFIVEEEAEVVRYIYKSYLNGISGPEIARSLTELGIPTVWLQPGADKLSVVEKAHALNLHVIQDCVLVQLP